MKNSFNNALAFTLKYEGGRSNNPNDPGGRTNQGVTQHTYDAYRLSKSVRQQDVYAMTNIERDDIYRHGYWDEVTGDSLNSGVDLCVFDFAVNSGPARALRTYASVGHGKKPSDAIHAVCDRRLSFLHALQTWAFFGTGWARRVAACEVEALKLAGAPLNASRDRVAGAGAGLSTLFYTFISAVGTVVGLSWEEFTKTHVAVVVAIAIVVALVYYRSCHHTAIRVEALSEASKASESLKAAVSHMQDASKEMMHSGSVK